MKDKDICFKTRSDNALFKTHFQTVELHQHSAPLCYGNYIPSVQPITSGLIIIHLKLHKGHEGGGLVAVGPYAS